MYFLYAFSTVGPETRQESNVEIAARSCDIASMDAVQQLAQQLKEMPRVAGGARGWEEDF